MKLKADYKKNIENMRAELLRFNQNSQMIQTSLETTEIQTAIVLKQLTSARHK